MTTIRPRLSSAVRAALLLAALSLAGASGCGKGDDSGAAAAKIYKQENTPENLKGLLEAMVKAQEAGDLQTAAALAKSLIVDAGTLKKFFKDDAPEAFMKEQKARLTRFPVTEAELSTMVRRGSPLRTQLNVHGATTEAIAAGETNEAKEFSPVPKDFVAMLRPGTTFYETEFVEPGKEAGRKHHLFLWDGERWRMLGPNWR